MKSLALAAGLFLCASSAQAKTVSYAVIIGENTPPQVEGSELPPLRFADDDAVRYDAFFARFTAKRWLLTVMDDATLRRYPGVAAAARPPTLAALRLALSEVEPRMRADAARGDEPVLYFTFSGHGAYRSDGAAYLALADGELTREVLYREVLSLPAAYVHLFIDACHAEAVVGSRGEREAARVRLSAEEAARVVDRASLRRFPSVGALLATTAEQESHEWAQVQSGIFTHEVLSGLSGAADVNADGVIEYSELHAFVAAANHDIKDPRALQQIIALPPARNPRSPLVVLGSLSDVAFLQGDLSALGHFHVELDDGERYLDANLTAELRSRIAIPARRRASLVAGDREAELSAEPGESRSVAALRFVPKDTRARGSLDQTFRAALFRSAFGPTWYEGFADSAGSLRVTMPSPEAAPAQGSPRRGLAIGGFVAGAVSVAGAGVLGLLALQAKNEWASTNLQRPAEQARARYRILADSSIAAAVAGAALVLAGAVIWPWRSSDGGVALSVSPWGLGLAGAW